MLPLEILPEDVLALLGNITHRNARIWVEHEGVLCEDLVSLVGDSLDLLSELLGAPHRGRHVQHRPDRALRPPRRLSDPAVYHYSHAIEAHIVEPLPPLLEYPVVVTLVL